MDECLLFPKTILGGQRLPLTLPCPMPFRRGKLSSTCADWVRTLIEYRHLGGVWEMADYADFTCLQYPIYLPTLEKLAANKDADKRALMGIAHIPTPEATGALFRLLEGADPDRVRRIASALCDRLPVPQGVNGPGRVNPIEAEDADPQLVKQAWRSDFAAQLVTWPVKC